MATPLRRAHVIGGGLAGLAAAMTLADAGWQVSVYEAGPACGGRCRSYFDRELGVRIDNGNHLLLSGNHAAFAYLDKIGTRHTLRGPQTPVFAFVDLKTREHWVLRPSAGRIPLWLLNPQRRVPGTVLSQYFGLLRLAWAGAEATVARSLASSILFRRLIGPLAISALNTPVETASAQLFFAIIRETLLAGGQATIPAFPSGGLSESFIDPAIDYLTARGATVRTQCRVSGLVLDDGRVTCLNLPDGALVVAPDDRIVLAVPPNIASALLPGIAAPDQFESILNVHYQADADGGEAGFVGVVGGLAEWVFVKPGIVSVTVSAANWVIDQDGAELAARIWPEVVQAVRLPAGMAMPAFRVVKERRATFAATPAMAARRAGVAAGPRNVALAGDWTATGLPATIEGAIRSGETAARHLLNT